MARSAATTRFAPGSLRWCPMPPRVARDDRSALACAVPGPDVLVGGYGAAVLGALVTVLFREGIHGLEWLLVNHSASLVEMALGLAPWQRLLLPVIGGLLAGLILDQIGARLRGRRTTN